MADQLRLFVKVPAALTARECGGCGREFMPNNHKHRHCSRRCMPSYRRDRPDTLVEVPWLGERLEAARVSRHALAERMGWRDGGGNIKRILRTGRCRTSTAYRLLDALGLDPVDVGL